MRSSLLAVVAFLLTGCDGPAFNGIVLDPPERAPSLQLADSAGARFDLGAQRGKVVLVFFGYTHCPDVCPTTLLDWRKAAASLGEQAGDARFVFVSLDPERDTPAIAQRYAARIQPGFVGLTGTRQQIDDLMREWKIAAYRDGIPGDTSSVYTVTHPSQVFVIDGEGRLRLMHRAGLTPEQIASDIRALL
ncbi:MAG: SCO family protein [Gemmatimonadota bacterium]